MKYEGAATSMFMSFPSPFQVIKPNMMKTKLILATIFSAVVLLSYSSNKTPDDQSTTKTEYTLIGNWVRMGQMGPIGFAFKENRLVEVDFGNDQTVDAVATYEIAGDTIKFIDKEGQMCKGVGQYRIEQTNYYVSFDLIDDACGGRIKTTMGFWVRPDFNDALKLLDGEISTSPKPESYLNRARVYLATGMTKQAQDDFDNYLLTDTLDARVYVNRAGTKFPNDLNGVVIDCNKAISIDTENKNAYFLRGLARYGLGDEEQGCEDFSKAIELGFTVLRIAEQEKCGKYWNEE